MRQSPAIRQMNWETRQRYVEKKEQEKQRKLRDFVPGELE